MGRVSRFLKRREIQEVGGIKLFVGYIGVFLMLIGIILLVPLFLLIFYPSESQHYYLFLGPGLISLIIGAALFMLIFHRKKTKLKKWQSFALLVTVWLVSIFIASLPFMLTDQFNFTQAIFEATGGFTTTAISLMDEVALAECDHIFIFYRCWLLFTGGIGLTLILTSAMSDANGLSIYNLEGHNDRLLPNLIKSSRIIFLIYFIYIVIGVGAYCACGMEPFQAVCNSISGLSTGGFTAVPGGIGSYHSIPIEIVTEILMLLGATNFMIHFAIIRGKFKNFFYHSELYCFLVLVVLFLPIMVTGYTMYYNNVGTGFRHGIFSFVSAITSSGFVINNPKEMFENLNAFVYFPVITLMIVGGQAGSTSGGIKQMRLVQVVKQCYWHVQDLIRSPRIVAPHTIIRYGVKENVKEKEFNNASSFVFIYLGIILFGTFLLTCFGYDFQSSLFEFTSMITTTGYSCGIMHYAASPGILWIGIIAMIIGRLEPLIFITLIAKGVNTTVETVKHKHLERQLDNN